MIKLPTGQNNWTIMPARQIYDTLINQGNQYDIWQLTTPIQQERYSNTVKVHGARTVNQCVQNGFKENIDHLAVQFNF